MAIAYFALCALHDLDADAETVSFRQTRLELHRRLDPQSAEPPKGDEEPPPLYLVR
ncbi:MAG TPA: hypothetical protein VGV69_05965 [Solirubrobacterales bacterium]|nr:hypothetical protein [Solirubrobacterales bacterium]